MKNVKIISITLFSFILLISITSFRNQVPKKSSTSIVVIINNSNPVTTLSLSETKLDWLRKIKTRWTELNKNIKPVDYKTSSSSQQTFYAKVLGMSADDVETYFFNKQYQNAQKPQDKFATDYEIVNFVAQEPGAIGFIDLANATSDVRAKVKVVLTVTN